MSARHRVTGAPGNFAVEIVNVRNRREVMLERPPFCLDGETWRKAVDRTRDMKRKGSKGEPFIMATQFYRQLGGRFA